jgi:hypothetical protein
METELQILRIENDKITVSRGETIFELPKFLYPNAKPNQKLLLKIQQPEEDPNFIQMKSLLFELIS